MISLNTSEVKVNKIDINTDVTLPKFELVLPLVHVLQCLELLYLQLSIRKLKKYSFGVVCWGHRSEFFEMLSELITSYLIVGRIFKTPARLMVKIGKVLTVSELQAFSPLLVRNLPV